MAIRELPLRSIDRCCDGSESESCEYVSLRKFYWLS